MVLRGRIAAGAPRVPSLQCAYEDRSEAQEGAGAKDMSVLSPQEAGQPGVKETAQGEEKSA